MKTLVTKWYTDEHGPKLFYSDSKRVRIHEFQLNKYNDFKKQVEENFEHEGVYILLGQTDEGNKKVYVGEADSINRRLLQHINDTKKGFADRVMVISSQMHHFPYSKTELHYLERKLIKKFSESDFEIENGNSGQGKALNKTERIGLDEELSLIFSGIESLGISLDDEIASTINVKDYTSNSGSIEIFAIVPKSKQKIHGLLNSDNSITIIAGQKYNSGSVGYEFSKVLVEKTLSKHKNYSEIEVNGNIDDYEIAFKKDFTYVNPSAASYLIVGGSVNGWILWKIKKDEKNISELRSSK